MSRQIQTEQRWTVVGLRASSALCAVAATSPTMVQWLVAALWLGIGLLVLPQPRSAPAPRWVLGVLGLALLGSALQRSSSNLTYTIVIFSVGLILAGWLLRGRALGSAAVSITLLVPLIMDAVGTAANRSIVDLEQGWVILGFVIMLVTRVVSEFLPDPIPVARFDGQDRSLAQPMLLMPIIVVTMIGAVGAAAIADGLLPVSDRRPPSLQWNAGDVDGDTLQSHPGFSGQLDAGDTPTLDEDIVLRVRSDRAMYWRGLTYDDYDGRYWTDTGPTQDFTIDAGTLNLQPGTSPIGSERLIQTFTVERAGLDVFLAADRMEVLHFDGFDGTWGLDDNSIRPTWPLNAGAQWTVESAIMAVDAEQLRASDLDSRQIPVTIDQRYAHEGDVSDATAELARQITADAPTTYDKVVALQDWFADNISYRRDVVAAPIGVDPVDRLLFDLNEGYCEQIASAMTVMLRSLGIPSRIAVGYVPSEFDDATGEWISRGTDAHAWTEVYFAGIGWQGFDPTSVVPLAGEQTPPTPATVAVPWMRIGLVVGLMLAVGLLTWKLVDARRRHRHPADVERLNRIGASLGIEWPESATLRERLDALLAQGVDPTAVAATRSAIEAAEFAADHDPNGTSAALDELEAAVAHHATV